jgi:hypothetical protein
MYYIPTAVTLKYLAVTLKFLAVTQTIQGPFLSVAAVGGKMRRRV